MDANNDYERKQDDGKRLEARQAMKPTQLTLGLACVWATLRSYWDPLTLNISTLTGHQSRLLGLAATCFYTFQNNYKEILFQSHLSAFAGVPTTSVVTFDMAT